MLRYVIYQLSNMTKKSPSGNNNFVFMTYLMFNIKSQHKQTSFTYIMWVVSNILVLPICILTSIFHAIWQCDARYFLHSHFAVHCKKVYLPNLPHNQTTQISVVCVVSCIEPQNVTKTKPISGNEIYLSCKKSVDYNDLMFLLSYPRRAIIYTLNETQ